jgi:hypothetical protein
VVAASGMAEVVRYAGGWLFDSVMDGWDVTVLTPDRADARPLRILGARSADLEAALACPVRGPYPQAIAVGADLYAADRRVRALVHRALAAGHVEVRLWGEWCPADLAPAVVPEPHRLSVAARAFKAQALGAAACPPDGRADGAGGEAMEMFRRGEPVRAAGVAPRGVGAGQ